MGRVSTMVIATSFSVGVAPHTRRSDLVTPRLCRGATDQTAGWPMPGTPWVPTDEATRKTTGNGVNRLESQAGTQDSWTLRATAHNTADATARNTPTVSLAPSRRIRRQ